MAFIVRFLSRNRPRAFHILMVCGLHGLSANAEQTHKLCKERGQWDFVYATSPWGLSRHVWVCTVCGACPSGVYCGLLVAMPSERHIVLINTNIVALLRVKENHIKAKSVGITAKRWIGIYLYLFLFLSVSVSLSLCVPLFFYFSLSFSVVVTFSLFMFVALFLTVTFQLVYLFLSLCLSFPLHLTLSICLSLSNLLPCAYLYFSQFLSNSQSISLTISLYISACISRSLSPFDYP